MSVQRLLLLCCLGVLVVVAGCSALPFIGQSDPVQIYLNNTANTTHTFEVWLVPLPADVTIQGDDGRVSNFTLGDGGLLTYAPRENATFYAVEPPESAHLHGRFALTPGEDRRSSIKADELPNSYGRFPSRFAVVVVVYQSENEIIEWAAATCGTDTLVGVEVTSRHIKPYPDIWAGYGCRFL